MKTFNALSVLAVGMAMMAAGTAPAEIVVRQPSAGGGSGTIAVPPPADGTGSAAGRSSTDVVEFINRDKLHGSLVSVKPADYGLRWKHECATKDIDFALRSISQVRLAGKKGAAPPVQGALVRLTNDDILTGNIVSLDADKLVLDTWYAGKMELRRYMVKTINPNVALSTVIYEGPNNLTEWVFPQHDHNHASWKLQGGALVPMQTYPIGRNIDKMPNAANFEIEMSWQRWPELMFAFYTDNLQNYYGNCYMLQVSGSSLNLYRCTRNGEQSSLGNVDFRRFRSQMGGRCKLNVLVDKTKKTLALLIDDALVQQWADPNGFAGNGNGILFHPQNQGNLRIHKIRITAWDGRISQPSDAGGSGGSDSAKEDMICFVNSDKISGALKTIDKGKAKLETSYAVMEVPVERITEIQMATDRGERARRFEHDVQARFAASGVVTLRLDALDGGKLTGFSENFGSVALPVDAFKLFKFNLYRKTETEPTGKAAGSNPPEDDDGDDGGDPFDN